MPILETAPRTIGRRRLPAGLVALVDNGDALREAIRELHQYATGDRRPSRPRKGIVFRVVEQWEVDAINQRLCTFLGPKRIAAEQAIYSVPLGHLHIIDDSFMSHACNRHVAATGPRHQLLLSLSDFEEIPSAVDPRHIREFVITKGVPRIIYEMPSGNSALVVIQELQAKGGLCFKTAYRKN